MLEGRGDIVLQEDLEIIAKDKQTLSNFDNSVVLVTGATGLVGSQIIRALACYNRINGAGIKILALIRSLDKAKIIYGDMCDREDIQFVVGDITKSYEEYLPSEIKIDYIFHAASITTSKVMVENPVETIKTALSGTENMLEIAKNHNSKGMVYISSMEMYGIMNSDEPVIEENIGYINPLAVRSNYPESKRMCENMCIAYMSQFGVDVKIARLSQTFGAGILPGENRVFAQFARSVIEGKNIILHTTGDSEGNYCYTRDTVKALFTIMFKGESGEAYNVSNEESHTTIADMARMVTEKIAKGKIALEFDIPEENTFGYAPKTKMKLCTDKIKSLGWKPEVGLEEAYIRLIKSMTC